MFRIALALAPVAGSIEHALSWVERYIAEAAHKNADVVCFPEAYIPGLRGQGFDGHATWCNYWPLAAKFDREPQINHIGFSWQIDVVTPA